jgi:hypothetical protein
MFKAIRHHESLKNELGKKRRQFNIKLGAERIIHPKFASSLANYL